MHSIDEYYTYYVQLLGISEEIFWRKDIAFVKNIAENKDAFDGWQKYALEKERERIAKK